VPIWSVYSGYSPDFTLALTFKQLILKREDDTVLRTIYPPRGLKGVKMDYIRERNLSDGSKRFYAEVELKGAGPRLTATFKRKSGLKMLVPYGIKPPLFPHILIMSLI